MRRDIRTAAAALLILTILLGFGYSLALTGISQVLFGDRADGSRVTDEGRVAGSKLIGQDFSDDDSYFQSRPSASGYAGDATAFSNLGPNSRRLARQLSARADAYLKLEGPYNAGLTRAEIPPDAVMTSASGVDPMISVANARIQANRVAAVREMPVAEVDALIDEHTTGRGLGFLGEPGVNVLELNLALDGVEPR
ncbi:MAG: K(+)-transporting ATPase subunit C [Solirubrobacterales bacterium]|nr:K(+)-transporting ATPase subunit C [Solirubrobacterales bacterium]